MAFQKGNILAKN